MEPSYVNLSTTLFGLNGDGIENDTDFLRLCEILNDSSLETSTDFSKDNIDQIIRNKIEFVGKLKKSGADINKIQCYELTIETLKNIKKYLFS